MAKAPEPVIRCLLPEYEDKHYQWLIWQYLERSGFNHTLSAFTLELNLRGINAGEFATINQEDLQRHFACLLTRQIVGPSAAVPVATATVLQLCAGTAAAPNTTAAAGNPLQPTCHGLLDSNGCDSRKQHQSDIGGDVGPRNSLPADIGQQHCDFDDQSEHARAHVRPQYQHKQQVHSASKVPHRPPASTADKQEQIQQRHVARNEQLDCEQQRLRRHSSVSDQHSQLQHHQQQLAAVPSSAAAAVEHLLSAAAGRASTAPAKHAAAAAASPTAALECEPKSTAAVEQPKVVPADAGAAAVQGAPQAAGAAHVTGQLPAESVAADVDDTLDFGDEEEEAAAAAAAAAGAAAHKAGTAATAEPAADGEHIIEEQHHQEQEEDEEHLLSGVTEMSSEDDARHRQDDQAAVPVHKGLPAAKPLARGDQKPPLRVGKVPVPYPPPAAQQHNTNRPLSPSRSRSKTRSRSRKRGGSSSSRSRSWGRARRRSRHHSSSRSRNRGRRGGSSSGARSRTHSPVSRRRSISRGRSYSRSRSGRSHSRSSRDRSRRSRSRDSRSRSGTRSRSPGCDAAGSRRNSYQGTWQRRTGGDHNSHLGQQQQWARGGRQGGAVYTNFRNRGRGGFTTNNNRNGDWPSDNKGDKDHGNQIRGEGTVQGGRGLRGGRATYGQQRDNRGYQQGGSRQYNGQYVQHSGNGRGDQQQHDGEDKDRHNNVQQQQAVGGDDHTEQRQQAVGFSQSQCADTAADPAGHGSDIPTTRLHRGGRAGRGRGRGRAAGAPAAAAGCGGVAATFTSPGQEGAITEGVTAPRVLGREGGKYDWPPRDADGNILQPSGSAPELAAIEPQQQAAGPRLHPRPMVRKYPATAVSSAGHWQGEAAVAAAPAGAAAVGTNTAAGSGTAAPPPPRQSVFQRLGDVPGQVVDLPSDRWQLRDDGQTSASPLPSPGSTVNKSASPKGPATGAGHAAAAKRKLGPSITDLSMDSSAGGASPASTAAAGDAAPAKKARAGSPA